MAPGDAMIGVQLAQDLGVGVGERITIRTGGANDAAETFKGVRHFRFGQPHLNRRFVYIPLKSAQPLLGIPGGATNLYAVVAELFEADATSLPLEGAHRCRRGKLDGHQRAAPFSALNAQTISTRLIRIFTSIVVMLGIASVLVVSVVQKERKSASFVRWAPRVHK